MNQSQPWPRCCHLDPIHRRICGARATARSLGDPSRSPVDYFCPGHAPVAHESIQDDWFVPAVRIVLELRVGASSSTRHEAESEAVLHVEDQLRAIGLGGIVTLARFKWAEKPASPAPRVPASSWARGKVHPLKPNRFQWRPRRKAR